MTEDPDYFNINIINELNERYAGFRNREHGPDRILYPLPPMAWVDNDSTCFVTQDEHVTTYRDRYFCTACTKILIPGDR